MFTYAIGSHKGGVGKTTAAATIGAAFVRLGRRVLLIDMDPQAGLTVSVGAPNIATTVAEVLKSPETAAGAIVPCACGMEIIPASLTLAITLGEIAAQENSIVRLSLALSGLAGRFDVALIDCPSALGLAMGNALCAAQAVLVPVPCDYLSLRGFTDMRAICGAIDESARARLEIYAFTSMLDRRAAYSLDVLEEARSALGSQLLRAVVPRSVRLAQAPAMGTTVFDFAPRSSCARAYFQMAGELMEMETQYGTSERHSGRHTGAALQSGGGRTDGADERAAKAERAA